MYEYPNKSKPTQTTLHEVFRGCQIHLRLIIGRRCCISVRQYPKQRIYLQIFLHDQSCVIFEWSQFMQFCSACTYPACCEIHIFAVIFYFPPLAIAACVDDIYPELLVASLHIRSTHCHILIFPSLPKYTYALSAVVSNEKLSAINLYIFFIVSALSLPESL